MRYTCNKCGEYKDVSNFYSRVRKNKNGESTYYLAPCKDCRGIKSTHKKKRDKKVVEPDYYVDNLRNEIREYIRKIIVRGFMVNEVDFYKIISYFQDVFGFRSGGVNDEPLNEVIMNWKKLYEWYINDEPLVMGLCKCCNTRYSIYDMKLKKKCMFCFSKEMLKYYENKVNCDIQD